MRNETKVAVIGGGWAGCAAAVELADAGLPVTLFDPAKRLGGRARSVDHLHGLLDNGQHILLGAYRETLRLMEKVSANSEKALWRHPLHLSYPGSFDLSLPRLPAPWHLALGLLGARGPRITDKWRAARFIQALQNRQFKLEQDQTVAELLASHGQGEHLTHYLWEPLCLAALNTPMRAASAQVFCNVLRDGLCGSAADSDLVIPLRDLSALFPDPARHFLTERGGTLESAAVRRLDKTDRGIALQLDQGEARFSHVVCAAPPWQLPRLMGHLPAMGSACGMVKGFGYEPITTVSLQYPVATRLPFPMLGLADGPGQWVFDLGQLGRPLGLVSAIISASGPHETMDHDALAREIHARLCRLAPLPPPVWHQVITEKRATFACTPGLARPETRTPVPGLYLAGDYTAGDYPATLEGAVRSGVKCAALLIESLR